MKYIVYRYTSPSKKSYIGTTYHEAKRKKEHRQKETDFSQTNKFARAIQKYGYSSLHYEVLERFDNLEQMLEREIYWIGFYDSIESGYNHHTGGTSGNAPKYDKKVIDDIKYMLTHNNNLTLQQIADTNGVSIAFVSTIKNGKTMRNFDPIKRQNLVKKGSENGQSKLTEQQVSEIKGKLQSGIKRKEIQIEYEISKTLVQLIATGQAWSHVESTYEYKPLEVNGNAKLTDQIVKELKKDLETMRVMEVKDKYNISEATVYQIKQGKTWKHIK